MSMSTSSDTNVAQTNETKSNEKEYNFAALNKKLEAERQARIQAEIRLQELEKERMKKARHQDEEDEEEFDEPYVDNKKLNKRLESFEQLIEKKIEEKSEMKARALIEQEKINSYLKENPDFDSVMSEENVKSFADRHPGLAQAILKMPDGFERQRLVYENIKAINEQKSAHQQKSIQEKIDANKRSPFYQPSGFSGAPYGQTGDFSEAGKKAAYEQMKALKARLGWS